MTLPNDPILLLSVLNTKLRDFYDNLGALCDDLSVDQTELEQKMKNAGFIYDPLHNQFK